VILMIVCTEGERWNNVTIVLVCPEGEQMEEFDDTFCEY